MSQLNQIFCSVGDLQSVNENGINIEKNDKQRKNYEKSKCIETCRTSSTVFGTLWKKLKRMMVGGRKQFGGKDTFR